MPIPITIADRNFLVTSGHDSRLVNFSLSHLGICVEHHNTLVALHNGGELELVIPGKVLVDLGFFRRSEKPTNHPDAELLFKLVEAGYLKTVEIKPAGKKTAGVAVSLNLADRTKLDEFDRIVGVVQSLRAKMVADGRII